MTRLTIAIQNAAHLEDAIALADRLADAIPALKTGVDRQNYKTALNWIWYGEADKARAVAADLTYPDVMAAIDALTARYDLLSRRAEVYNPKRKAKSWDGR